MSLELRIISPSEEGFVKAIVWNHEEIEKAVAEKMSYYRGLVYTDDQIIEAKKDRAALNKFVAALKAKDREIKKLCLQPYEEFHAKMLQIIAQVEEPAALILNDNSEWRPSRDDLDGWQRLYVGVDVIRELARMREWCKSNPTKRKTRKGIRRFVQTWLDRQQNQPNRYGAVPAQKDKFTQRMEDMQNWGQQFEDNNQH